MATLLEELKADHREILGVLDGILDLGSNLDAGCDQFLAAKSSLLAHLKKEDEQLYPLLYQIAQNNERVARALAIFATEMDRISQDAMSFFEKYPNGVGGSTFATDFGRIIAILKGRIKKEELILYPLYAQFTAES